MTGKARLNDSENWNEFFRIKAALAQLVEQLICNQPVVGSSPIGGSFFYVLGRYQSGQMGRL